jgi:hypothetical protein
MRLKLGSALAVGVSALALGAQGCSPAVHSVDWYNAHPAERQARIAECQRITYQDADCANASASLITAETSGIGIANPFAAQGPQKK